MGREITVMGRPTLANFGAAAVSLATGLSLAIQALAFVNGGRAGPWLDDLEARALRQIKATAPEGLSIEDDAEAVQYGHDVVKALFTAERESLPS